MARTQCTLNNKIFIPKSFVLREANPLRRAGPRGGLGTSAGNLVALGLIWLLVNCCVFPPAGSFFLYGLCVLVFILGLCFFLLPLKALPGEWCTVITTLIQNIHSASDFSVICSNLSPCLVYPLKGDSDWPSPIYHSGPCHGLLVSF